MADISAIIRRKSLKAKQKAAIHTIKQQTKEKIREIKLQNSENPEEEAFRQKTREMNRAHRAQKRNAIIAYSERHPRNYTLGENVFSSVTHGIGAALSVTAIILLCIKAYFQAPQKMYALYMASYVIFGASLFLMNIMATLYHALTPYAARKVFSILTHDSVYILIAGTYTPFVLTKIGGTAGWVIFFLIWGLAIVLVSLYSVFGRKLRSTATLTYFLLGWMFTILFAVVPLGDTLSNISRATLFAGGVSYTVGCGFYLLAKYKWTYCIFHVFTLIGCILHFFSVYFSM
ncbi:MAG: hemolysin III family protein [Treponema sp.]|nr:hemolysin III family protein [Treponema sp.]